MPHAVNSPWPSAPGLVLSVDVLADEPAGRRQRHTTVSCGPALRRVQRIAERFGVRPTYLVSFQALGESEVLHFVKTYARAGRCEIGALLDLPSNPPFLPGDGHDGSNCMQPPTEFVSQKLVILTDLLWQRTGVRPVSLRLRGFGATGEVLRAAAEFGYAVDASVLPGASYVATDGPDLRAAPRRPYHPAILDAAASGQVPLLEAPVSTVLPGATDRRLRKRIGLPPLAACGRPIALDPTAAPVDVMIGAVDAVLADEQPVIHLTLPAHALFPGASARAETPEQVDAFLRALATVLGHIVRARSAIGRTLCQLAWIDPECLRGAPRDADLEDPERRGDETLARISNAIDGLL